MAKEKPKRKPPVAPARKQTQPPSAGGYDTTLAAASAAALVGSGKPSAGGTPKKESSIFRQLKDGLNPAPVQAIGNVLDKSGAAGAKPSNLPFDQGGQQVGHNQTFGADVNRAGVPRRTGG